MHLWGDEWFKQHGDDLNDAIKYVEQRLHKWARVGVCGKEKHGTYRDEYFRMWDGGMTQIFFGYRAMIKNHFLMEKHMQLILILMKRWKKKLKRLQKPAIGKTGKQ